MISVAALGGFGYVNFLIFIEPGDHLNLDKIKKSVLTESTVYYKDGKTKLGAFYSEARRDYLTIPPKLSVSDSSQGTIPPLFLKAIVASEDQSFYDHIGVDPIGIFRAIIANLKAGRVVQGASTLTLQTSEALFEHKVMTTKWERWWEKVLETLDAFRLEAKYSKNQILEFYTNLFHVRGTGQGLSIAARYYFNKQVSELNLAEIAFIAGSVKGPANYTPFPVSDPDKKLEIIKRATRRRNYVLDNMLELGSITPNEHKEASTGLVEFNQGSFRFEESHQMDAVQAALRAEPWKTVLEENGIADLTQAEVNIYTTLDHNLQQFGQFAMKRHLSHLEFRIQNYTLPKEKPLPKRAEPKANEFYVGTIIQVLEKDEQKVVVQLGKEQGTVEGPYLEEFIRHVNNLAKRKKITNQHEKQAFGVLKTDDPILVSTHWQKSDGYWVLAIEQEPRLNGGVFVLQEGEVRGMIGGFNNSGFNRALQAKRQPGSTFKLPIFLASMHLGWSALDALPNEYRVYPYQKQFYFPRPDHTPKDKVSSMIWAGAKSENLATIYLLVHMADRLTPKQFKDLMHFTNLDRQSNESRQAYQSRLRDKWGINNSEEQLRAGIFEIIRRRMKKDFFIDESTAEALIWDQLFYGTGWEDAYDEREIKTNDKASRKRRLARERRLLKNNYLRLQELSQQMQEPLGLLEQNFTDEIETTLKNIDVASLKGFFYKPESIGDSYIFPLAYTDPKGRLPKEWKPLTFQELSRFYQLWDYDSRLSFFQPDNIWIDGKIRASVLNTAADLIGQLLEEAKQNPAYSPERLFYHHDFRIFLSLQTVIKLSEILGIQSELKPILSFPLGSNITSLDELALMYQAFATGEITVRPEENLKNSWKIIDRIEDAKGKIIYEDKRVRKRVLSESVSQEMREILHSVVEYGTGRAAKPFLTMDIDNYGEISTLRIPGYGKTGTANDYSNATFAGFIPAIQGGEVSMFGGYTITSYVGLDRLEADSEPLPFKLTGSSGALPVWSQIARYIIHTPTYQNKLDWAQLPELEPGDKFPIPYVDVATQKISSINGVAFQEETIPKKNVATVYLNPDRSKTVEIFPDIP